MCSDRMNHDVQTTMMCSMPILEKINMFVLKMLNSKTHLTPNNETSGYLIEVITKSFTSKTKWFPIWST